MGQARTLLLDLQRDVSRLERLQIDFSNSAQQIAEMGALQERSDLLKSELEKLKLELDRSGELRNEVTGQISVEREKSPYHASSAQVREHRKRLGLQDGRCPLCGSSVAPQVYEAHLIEIQQEIERQDYLAGQRRIEQ